ncbi:MAG: TetR/AcrR family transcriptional regulator [bacterium]|nr:TetR/AcrR family transcriptional regulator [bacterium]
MSCEERNLLNNPPEKVVLIYDAVVNLINENSSINTMKVVDITSRAGIGKGTAYEYFSSKEEIITKALMFDTMKKVESLKLIADSDSTFEEKVIGVLDFISDNFHENHSFCQLFKIGIRAYDVTERLYQEFEKVQDIVNCQQMEEIQDKIMDTAAREGLIKETNIMKRRMTLNSQVISYSLLLLMEQNNLAMGMTRANGKQFVLESIIKALN